MKKQVGAEANTRGLGNSGQEKSLYRFQRRIMMKRSIHALLPVLAIAFALGILATPAMAQRDPSDRWEFEFHLGGAAGHSFGSSSPSCISSSTPSFTTNTTTGVVTATTSTGIFSLAAPALA